VNVDTACETQRDMPQRLRGTENIKKDSLRLGVSVAQSSVSKRLKMSPAAGMAVAVLFVAGSFLTLRGQPSSDARLQAQLKRLFPTATAFSPKGGDPPHFKAFVTDQRSGLQTLLGLAFWTTELDPLERGYDGPIKMLVGMDTSGLLTGIIVTEHHEPYGDFSVDRAEFAAQFRGKNIRDPFKVGSDIDAVSRATITVTSASRAVRNSARRAARQLLTPPAAGK
jgi:NosR/NirI family transcriptional regulator, nitrous oxide reductase regulator